LRKNVSETKQLGKLEGSTEIASAAAEAPRKQVLGSV
jgi:hypothetical protein